MTALANKFRKLPLKDVEERIIRSPRIGPQQEASRGLNGVGRSPYRLGRNVLLIRFRRHTGRLESRGL